MTHKAAYKIIRGSVIRIDNQRKYLENVQKDFTTDQGHIDLANFYLEKAQRILTYVKSSDFRIRD